MVNVVTQTADERGVMFHEDAARELVSKLDPVKAKHYGEKQSVRLRRIEPLHLQVVCQRIWRKPRKDPRQITLEEIKSGEDVDSALREYFNSSLKQICKDDSKNQRRLRDLFQYRLTTEVGTRVPITITDKDLQAIPEKIIRQLEDDFHLLLKHSRLTGPSWYELAHDRLVGPVRLANDEWYEGSKAGKIHKLALKAKEEGYPEHHLISGDELREALLLDANELDPEDRELIQRSSRRQSSRTLRKWSLLGVVFSLFVASVTGWIWWHSAKTQRDRLDEIKWTLEGTLDELRVRELSNQVLALGTWSLRERYVHQNTDLAALLARVAYSVDEHSAGQASAVVDSALRNALTARPFNRTLMPNRLGWEELSAAQRVLFEPVRQWVAVLSNDGVLHILPMKTGEGTVEPLTILDQIFSDVAFSPDGRYLALASPNMGMLLQDLASDENLSWPLPPQPSSIIGPVAFTEDSDYLAGVQDDGRVRVWKTEESQMLGAFDPQVTDPSLLVVTHQVDGLRVAVGNRDGMVSIWGGSQFSGEWRLLMRKQMIIPQPREDLRFHEMIALGFNPDGSWLLTVPSYGDLRQKEGGWDSLFPNKDISETEIRLWDLDNPGRSLILAADDDSRRKEDNAVKAGRLVKLVRPQWITAAALSHNGKRLTIGGDEGIVRSWDMIEVWKKLKGPNISAKLVETRYENYTTQSGALRHITDHGDGGQRVVYTLDSTGRLRALQVNGIPDAQGHIESHGRGVEGLQSTSEYIRVVHFMSDDRMFSTGLKSGLVEWIVSDLSRPEKRLLLQHKGIRKLDRNADGSLLALAYWGHNPKAQLLLPDKNQCNPVDLEHEDGLWAIDLAPDGDLLVTASWDGFVRVWQVQSTAQGCIEGRLLEKLDHNGPVRSAALDPQMDWLVTGTQDGNIHVYSLRESSGSNGFQVELRQRLQVHGARPVHDLAFSRDGSLLASAGSDGMILIWKTGEWEAPKLRLPGSTGSVYSLDFHSQDKVDGSDGPVVTRLVSGGSDGKVRIWPLNEKETGILRIADPIVLHGLKSEVISVDFSPSGKLVAAGDGSGNVSIWIASLPDLVDTVCRNAWRGIAEEEWDTRPTLKKALWKSVPVCRKEAAELGGQ